MRPKRPDLKWCLPQPPQGLALTHHSGLYKGSLTAFFFTTQCHPQPQFAELHNPTPPKQVFHQYLKPQFVKYRGLGGVGGGAKEKLILCFFWKQNGISLIFLIGPYCHLKIHLVQRRTFSPVGSITMSCLTQTIFLSLSQSHTHTHILERSVWLPNTATTHYHNTISAKDQCPISLWLGNSFLFDFCRRKTKRTGQQLLPLTGRDSNTKALSPANFLTP